MLSTPPLPHTDGRWPDLLRRPWSPGDADLLVICPHPDDEALGCGGLIATQRRRGRKVTVIAATDGEAAYANRSARGLARQRRREHRAALAALDVPPDATIRAGLPDGRLSLHEESLIALIRNHVEHSRSHTLVVAPWVHDGHPDHEACGRAASLVSGDLSLVYYVIWGWYRSDPDSISLRPTRVLEFELAPAAIAARARALKAHHSQLHVEDGEPIVSAQMAADLLLGSELFVAGDTVRRLPMGSTSRRP